VRGEQWMNPTHRLSSTLLRRRAMASSSSLIFWRASVNSISMVVALSIICCNASCSSAWLECADAISWRNSSRSLVTSASDCWSCLMMCARMWGSNDSRLDMSAAPGGLGWVGVGGKVSISSCRSSSRLRSIEKCRWAAPSDESGASNSTECTVCSSSMKLLTTETGFVPPLQ